MRCVLVSLKTTMFKWKPDWELASEEFDKAGKQFSLAKNHAKAIESFKLASNAHKQYDQLYHAAQSLEHAANAAKDAKMTDVGTHCHRRECGCTPIV